VRWSSEPAHDIDVSGIEQFRMVRSKQPRRGLQLAKLPPESDMALIIQARVSRNTATRN